MSRAEITRMRRPSSRKVKKTCSRWLPAVRPSANSGDHCAGSVERRAQMRAVSRPVAIGGRRLESATARDRVISFWGMTVTLGGRDGANVRNSLCHGMMMSRRSGSPEALSSECERPSLECVCDGMDVRRRTIGSSDYRGWHGVEVARNVQSSPAVCRLPSAKDHEGHRGMPESKEQPARLGGQRNAHEGHSLGST